MIKKQSPNMGLKMKKTQNLKLTNKIKSFGPRLKWLMFSELQDLKLTSKYFDMICPSDNPSKSDSASDLEEMVKATLIKEFSPEIQNMKSFDLLVDAVVHNLKKDNIAE
jgi:DNA-binding NarL/FixJ family response regulator